METRRQFDEELLGLPHPEQSASHYATPEGFLEGLADGIMSRIPEQHAMDTPAPPVGWWIKARAVVYLAACFVGLALVFRVVQEVTQSVPQSVAGVEMVDESEWETYYGEYNDKLIDRDHEQALSLELNEF